MPQQGKERRRDRDTAQWSPVQVEREIMAISDDMEDATAELMTMADDKARAEAEYKRMYAQEWLKAKARPEGHGRGGTTTDGEAEQIAREKSADAYLDHLVTEAKYDAQKEALRSMRTALDALRTIAANIREQSRG